MSIFEDKNFLLGSEKAAYYYETYAKNLPIIDYHCHLEAKEIYEDIGFTNLTELWLTYDHYKWRLMRAAGVEEKYITGNASDKDKFIKWCEVCGRAIGNPLYHWSNLELNRYFGITEPLSEKNALDIWYRTMDALKDDRITARKFIQKSNVKLICTTNDPVEDLAYHSALAADSSFDVKVLPTFRPDPAFDIRKDSFIEYIATLSEVSGVQINSFDSLVKALLNRIDFFAFNGCVLADHGMTEIFFDPQYTDLDADKALKRRLNKSRILEEEACAFRTRLMAAVCKKYCELGWTVQIHYSCLRDANSVLLNKIGVNAGCDSIASGFDSITPLARMFDYLNSNSILPRMIIYSLNPNDNILIDTLIGSFQEHIKREPTKLDEIRFSDELEDVDKTLDRIKLESDSLNSENNFKLPRLIHGAAWWFNDSYEGIRNHLKTTAEQGFLPSFVGMLTDSRSFLSYTRHEYFRRILCDFIGNQVATGMFPDDEEIIGKIITDICFGNAASLFDIND